MIRRIGITAIAAAGLLAPALALLLLAGAPASAGSDLGCAGNDCSSHCSRSLAS